jgi:hypothetical protein
VSLKGCEFLKDPSPPWFSLAVLITYPKSLCSFFGFYDANETVLEMEEQLVSSLELFPLILATGLPHCGALPATIPWSKGLTLWGGGQDTSSNSLCFFLCLSSMLWCPFVHFEGVPPGFFWVEDSLGPWGHSEVSDGRDLPHDLAFQPYSLWVLHWTVALLRTFSGVTRNSQAQRPSGGLGKQTSNLACLWPPHCSHTAPYQPGLPEPPLLLFCECQVLVLPTSHPL